MRKQTKQIKKIKYKFNIQEILKKYYVICNLLSLNIDHNGRLNQKKKNEKLDLHKTKTKNSGFQQSLKFKFK